MSPGAAVWDGSGGGEPLWTAREGGEPLWSAQGGGEPLWAAYPGDGAVQPFSPLSLPGLVLWLDASQLSGLIDGDPVTTWTDLSGFGNSPTQATAGKKPIYRTGIANGLPIVRFAAASQQYLQAADAASLDVTSLTAYIVWNWTGSGIRALLAKRDTAGAAFSNYELFANFNEWNGSTYTGPNDTSTGFRVGTWTWQTGAFQPYKNGSAFSSYAVNLGAANAQKLTVGASMETQEWFTGDIAEIILCNVVHGASDRAATETYLGHRWGVAGY